MLIDIKDVYKIYNEGEEREVRALNGVSLNIDRGEFVEHSGLSGYPHLRGLSPGRPGCDRSDG